MNSNSINADCGKAIKVFACGEVDCLFAFLESGGLMPGFKNDSPRTRQIFCYEALVGRLDLLPRLSDERQLAKVPEDLLAQRWHDSCLV